MSGSIAIYVHLPWCVSKCPYCDFNSHAAAPVIPEADYVAALTRDLEFDLADFHVPAVRSVFFGGGTPSLFSGKAIAAILEYLDKRAGLQRGCEITLEANPGTVDQNHFNDYRAAGVNRLSIGAQSFRIEMLQRLGRVHGPQAIADAVRTARACGFSNINIDLMYALPQDDVAGSQADLQAALALEPTHLSWYQLTLEPGTAFYRKPPSLPGETLIGEIEAMGHTLLGASGFRRYEVSAWATEAAQCQHNLNYWLFGDYLGLGAGAHGKLTKAGTSDYWRTAKALSPNRYLSEAGTEKARELSQIRHAGDKLQEYLLGALRLDEGFLVADCARATDVDVDLIRSALAKATDSGLTEEKNGRLRLNASGLQHLDSVLANLELPT